MAPAARESQIEFGSVLLSEIAIMPRILSAVLRVEVLRAK
jgi:hypothetical protein